MILFGGSAALLMLVVDKAIDDKKVHIPYDQDTLWNRAVIKSLYLCGDSNDKND
jgi:hypothetical protein